ncbi:MAG: acyl-ACP--UDP-N-acetylglucosamine O-acyltransferase [Verrucomicrobiaceae bacterium]|nr:acyl-ACP--UDP-N-acetylglucosamine O-acyltransferase [Verrucomicrobiaceae bacterium]
MSIHPTALVDPAAELGSGVKIGPYAIIESHTRIGDDCVIEGAAQIRSGSRIGGGTFVGAGAILGSNPQLRGFDESIRSGIRVGERNVLREYVTIHRSIHEGEDTVLGDENYLMAGAHMGHDSLVGDGNTLANDVLLGGYVRLGNHCFIGGASAFHQFVRVGDYVMCQGHSGFSQDLPPFVIGADINTVIGINAVGMKRAGFSPEERRAVKQVFQAVYRSPTTLQSILETASQQENPAPLEIFYRFLREPSKKGLCVRSSRRPVD